MECLLGSLPPAAACANDAVPPGFTKHVSKASSTTTTALHASTARKRHRLLRKLDALLVASDRIATKATHKRKIPLSTGCGGAIHAVLEQAEGLVTSAEAGQ